MWTFWEFYVKWGMTEEVWFKHQNSMSLFIEHFACTNKRSIVANRRAQETDVAESSVGIDIEFIERKLNLWKLLQEGLRNDCEVLSATCYFVQGWISLPRKDIMKRISITIRADVSSVFTCSKMSYVSLNKLPFLYCHDESLTINISHKAQERERER